MTREKALEQAQKDFDAVQNVAQNNYNTLGQTTPVVPTSDAERINLERSGYLPTEGGYVTPQSQMMANERQYLDYEAQQNLDAYKNKLQSPLFNVGDTLVDLTNNTVGLPIKFLSGGQNLITDPSKALTKGYQKSLEDIRRQHAENQGALLQDRDRRSKTFLDSLKGGGVGVSDLTAGHYTNQSLARFKQTGDFNDLEFRKPNTFKVGDITYIETPQGYQPIVPMQDALANQQQFQSSEEFTRAQSAFKNNQSKLDSALKSATQKHTLLKGNIEKALKLIRSARGAGWNGLLRNLPDSIARDLNATLDTIKANVAFTRLQEMRENSPTGGALGNVSEREIELLYSSLMPLDQLGSDELLENSLLQIESVNKNTLDNMRDGYNQDVGYFGGRTYIKELNVPSGNNTITDEQKNKLKEHDKLFGL